MNVGARAAPTDERSTNRGTMNSVAVHRGVREDLWTRKFCVR